MKRLFLIAAGVFLIAGAYGCSGLGTGTGSGFQGGTEAGNPPTDGGFIGGTEAGNPPTGETTGGKGDPDPREGSENCDLPDTPEKEGRYPCPEFGDEHRVEMLSPEQMGQLHDHQDQENTANEGIHINHLPNNSQQLNGALGDFGHAESVDDDKDVITLPPSGTMKTILKNIK
jgi:hypothetical protein